MLRRVFSTVTLRILDVQLSIPAPQPVIAYVASLREPIFGWTGEAFDFDAVLDDIAMKVEQAIQGPGQPPGYLVAVLGGRFKAYGGLGGCRNG